MSDNTNLSSDNNAVFYTDGGSRPNNGNGGWGIHGYEYDEQPVKRGTGLKEWEISPTGYIRTLVKGKESEYNLNRMSHWEIYPERAKDPKDKNVNVLFYHDLSGTLGNPITNNHAELVALIECMKLILKKEYAKVFIFIDSRYVLDGITEWVHKWVKYDWTKPGKAEIVNVDLWKELYYLAEAVKAKTEVVYNWVKGHVGNVGNEAADHNATMGVVGSYKNIEKVTHTERAASGYWNPKGIVNRIIPLRYWYFNSYDAEPVMHKSGKVMYHFGDHGKVDSFIGKPLPDTCYSIVVTPKPIDVLEKVRVEHARLDCEGKNSIVAGDINLLFNAYNSKLILEQDADYLYTQRNSNDLYNPMKVKLTKELNPPRISFNLIMVMSSLNDLLDSYLEKKTNRITIDEITDTIYTKNNKGKTVISSDITSLTKALDVDVPYVIDGKEGSKNIPLTLAHDLPSRNSLAGLAPLNPKVFVISWKESHLSFRYATIVDTEDDTAIFAGFYSNLALINE